MSNPKPHLFRRCIIAGLLVWLPIWATLLVIRFIVRTLDQSLALLPKAYQPQILFGFSIPGLGVVVSILIVFVTGLLVTNFLGRRLVSFWESIVARIPLVSTIHYSVKKVLETLFSAKEPAFRKVLLVEYPRKGLWTIAFQTGPCWEEVQKHTEEDMIMTFIPTTPNPTSGFLIMVPRQDVRALSMSVDEALRLVISLGVVQPSDIAKMPLAQPANPNG